LALSEPSPVRGVGRWCRLALLACLSALLAGCGGDRRSLVIVTTNDVAGKTSPCGCHTPKGGLARKATFLDSVRTKQANVLVLDAGGFFPATDDEREAAPFMLVEMARMRTAAAGVGVNELRYGYAFAREHARSAGVPLVCANLVRFDDGQPAFEGWRIVESGGYKVGVFGLIAHTADLGPARDSLRADVPDSSARRAIAALREGGAEVVVLLSQLGKAEGESLLTRVEGIDLVVGGGGVPALPSGQQVAGAIALYGGNQGWHVGVADVRLTPERGVRDIAARTVVLDPAVRDQPAMLARVKAFEDTLNAHLQARDAALGAGPTPGSNVPHFVGMSNCIKCHVPEFEQWKQTPHARAWATLTAQRKESTPACVSCHVTGYREPGGFRTADDAARLANVQCESCHGMGTQHRQWTDQGNTVSEATCRSCHTETTSPTFTMAAYRPHVLHEVPAGLKPLPESPAKRLMREGKDPHGR
jgi:hypothetical protein